jgi:hypothetical protein
MPGAAMTTVELALRDLVRIEDPQFCDPFPVFARMRAEAPAFYYEPACRHARSARPFSTPVQHARSARPFGAIVRKTVAEVRHRDQWERRT